ncbi:MAG: ACT domain-containing protein [Acidobacteria bacterium]|nr:ACT domain-containing protein [Acidobacteriota bacterium]
MPGSLAICRLAAEDPVPLWATQGAFCCLTRTPEELSVVCQTDSVPSGVKAERGWRALAVRGPLDFGQTGIVAELTGRLAAAAVSVFVVSTYDTDYLLVRENDTPRAIAALRDAGHTVSLE